MTKRLAWLTDLDRRVLTLLARLGFATSAQLTAWLHGVSRSMLAKRVALLRSCKLVAAETVLPPHILRLTAAGARAVDWSGPVTARPRSWSVMAHTCHRNSAELQLRAVYPGLTFQPRTTVWRWGLRPAFAEHGARLDDTRRALLVLDDALLPPARIRHAYTRAHRPHPRYWTGPFGQRWADVASDLLVASTDARQVERHRRQLRAWGQAATVVYVPPLWRLT
jgi:hypothetical protein